MKTFSNEDGVIYNSDCLNILKNLPEKSIDAVITDPPYGLSDHNHSKIVDILKEWLNGNDSVVPDGKGFMGKDWDAFVPPPAVWKECLRTLKPGGHMLVFAGTRTVDLMGISLRLGGFEIRDKIVWCYGSGFPKSIDISKSIDRMLGVEREIIEGGIGKKSGETYSKNGGYIAGRAYSNKPISPEAKQWQGWGTALKPANEPIVLARKPLSEKNIAENVMKWGTGGLNIDGCRIPVDSAEKDYFKVNPEPTEAEDRKVYGFATYDKLHKRGGGNEKGRFPANVILDEEAGKLLDEQAGGNPSRFFYCAKASKKERADSKHPTVKPLSLMRYLCRLITPPEGIVLDPFAGSGTTLEAAILEGFNVVGIEKEHDYILDIRRRIERAQLNTQAMDKEAIKETND